MDESITPENRKQKRQKPPLSFVRIAGEILVGSVMGFAVAVPVSYAIAYVFLYVILGAPPDWPEDENLGLAGFLAWGVIVLSFLILCGPVTIVGVYLVGSRGKQTGSFLATAGGLFLAAPVIALLYLYIDMAEYKTSGIVKIVLWTLVFLAPPIMATLCFNLTRRYKELPSSS